MLDAKSTRGFSWSLQKNEAIIASYNHPVLKSLSQALRVISSPRERVGSRDRRFSKVRQCGPLLIKISVGSFVTDNCGVNLTLPPAVEEKLFTNTGGTFLAGMGRAGFFSCLEFLSSLVSAGDVFFFSDSLDFLTAGRVKSWQGDSSHSATLSSGGRDFNSLLSAAVGPVNVRGAAFRFGAFFIGWSCSCSFAFGAIFSVGSIGCGWDVDFDETTAENWESKRVKVPLM